LAFCYAVYKYRRVMGWDGYVNTMHVYILVLTRGFVIMVHELFISLMWVCLYEVLNAEDTCTLYKTTWCNYSVSCFSVSVIGIKASTPAACMLLRVERGGAGEARATAILYMV